MVDCEDCIVRDCKIRYSGLYMLACPRYKSFWDDYAELKQKITLLDEVLEKFPDLVALLNDVDERMDKLENEQERRSVT